MSTRRQRDRPTEIREVERLLSELEANPLAPDNRAQAEEIERGLSQLSPARPDLVRRLRAIRDPLLPQVVPHTWRGELGELHAGRLGSNPPELEA